MSTQNDNESLKDELSEELARLPRKRPFAHVADSDKQERIVAWTVIFGAVALAVLMTAGVLSMRACQSGPDDAAAPVRMAPAAPVAPAEPVAVVEDVAEVEAAPVGDGPAVHVQEGVVKFYFATGKAELAEGAKEALADIVRGVAAGQMAVVSGFHDATGNAAFNAELAKKRAEAVRAALLELGVSADKVTLQKPEAAEANTAGSNAAARRVEVRLQ